MPANMRMGKSTFSSTVCESNSAEPWNSMPISLRISLRWRRLMAVKLRPPKWTDPSSGSISPTIHLVITDLPEPLWPMMKFTWPVSNLAEMPLSTWLSPKRF